MPAPSASPPSASASELAEFVREHGRLLVLTGAGCSTASGIPDYRDLAGGWKRRRPVLYQDFVRSEHARRRYWARSQQGYPVMSGAAPNAAHRALAALERVGAVSTTLTQNVDGLHQAAGSREVIELHGSVHRVCCTRCQALLPRRAIQDRLERLNPRFRALTDAAAPDGDADLAGLDAPGALDGFRVPACDGCGGVLKPDVVFFGESVPRERVERAYEALASSDAVLVVGSSLMVFSGFRFVREAVRRGIPVAAVNLGATRADALLTLKVTASCTEVLAALDPERGAHPVAAG